MVEEKTLQQRVKDAVDFMKMDVAEINYSTLNERYRTLSKEYHPDTGGASDTQTVTSHEMMLQLNEANETIREEIENGGTALLSLQSALRKFNPELHKEYDDFMPKTKPYAHQVAAFNRHKDSEYFALFMDMGTGKTKIGIDIASYKFLSGDIDAVLVIAPNHVHIQWINEQFPIHCNVSYFPFIWEQKNFTSMKYKLQLGSFIEDKMDSLKVFACNVEAFQASTFLTFSNMFLRENRTMVILDESTRIKNPDARRTKKILPMHRAAARCILTGTPTAKSPLDIFAPFNFLKDDYFQMPWNSFKSRYQVLIKDRASHHRRGINEYDFQRVKSAIANWKGRGDMFDCYSDVADQLGMSARDVRFLAAQERASSYRDEDQLRDIIAPDTFSIKKEDCLDLPEKIYEKIFVDMSVDQKKAYDHLAMWYHAEMEETGAVLDVRGTLALLVRFTQICGGFFPQKTMDDDVTTLIPFKKNPKLQTLLDDVEENCNDKQFIVWACYQAEIRAITKALQDAGYVVDTYYGPDSLEKRQQTIAKFASGEIQVMVANNTVAGYGLNLQFCSYQYFYSNNFRTEARLQAEDRTHRIGQKYTCVYKDILVNKSVDIVIHAVIRAGKELNDYFKNTDLEDVLDGTYVDEQSKSVQENATAYLQ